MKVLIIGGGFGGVRAALNLAGKKGFEVRLMSDKSYFEYHAALYRSATGRSPLEVAIPLQAFFKSAGNVEVIEDSLKSVDAKQHVALGVSDSRYPYDALILALGNITQYFGIPGLKEYSFGVKTIQEALELKRHLHEDLVNNSPNQRHYVVVGAGATGIELAAEMTAYLKKVRKRHGLSGRFTMDLIEAAGKVMPNLPEDFTNHIQVKLQKSGVKLHLNSPVKAETLEGIELPSGHIKTQTVVWTAGVANNPFFKRADFKLSKRGRVEVDQYLQAAPDVYVIGDSAETMYSGMAQTALHDANFVTTHLMRAAKQLAPKSYEPQKPIYAIPVGPHWSAVLWGKVRIYGFAGWTLRRLADLRLYLRFLPFVKALSTWRYGILVEEQCPVCK